MRCIAYCTAAGFEVAKLNTYLRAHYGVDKYRDVLHIQLTADSNDPLDSKEVFFFSYGAIVCWGLREDEEHNLLKEIKEFALERLDSVEDDIFSYEYGETMSIKDDEITLPEKDVLTKLAFSHAIAQSVKLAVFEHTIQKNITITKKLPELLAQKGGINLSKRDIRKMMGRLFVDRSSINLHQELLDTPEFFWEHADLEPYYSQMAHYLDKERRVNVLNQRLSILKELLDMLATELNHQHSSRLEWTIIWLIVMEVALHLAASDIFAIFK